MPSLPSTPCPVHGLVPWAQGVWPIVWRAPHPVLHWVYTIHAKPPNEPLHIHWNVSQADIVRAMLAHAAFRTGAYVQLGPMVRRRIVQRKWSFERGCFFYRIEGSRPGREWSVSEEELKERMKG